MASIMPMTSTLCPRKASFCFYSNKIPFRQSSYILSRHFMHEKPGLTNASGFHVVFPKLFKVVYGGIRGRKTEFA